MHCYDSNNTLAEIISVLYVSSDYYNVIISSIVFLCLLYCDNDCNKTDFQLHGYSEFPKQNTFSQ